ncbi:MAG: 2-oxo acid dehydrogenase subunit E2 [Planctomycetaceae bacterium]|nr:2-oxo acid dehydrogenase subunit E2 [Planctomycetaceae bacterium]
MITPVVFDPGRELGATPRPALVEWLAAEGELVDVGTPLCRYEIDKAVLTVASPASGYLRRYLVPAGARFSSGDVLALLAKSLDETLPETRLAHLPNEKDIRGFDWSEIDNHGGPAEPLTVMRRAIADRMAMSKRHIPCFYLTGVVDMSACIELRRTLKKQGRKATFNDMAIRASAIALTRHPRAVSVYTPEGLVPRSDLHIGFAAALPDEGLVVPVVKNADKRCLVEIATDTRTLAEKAKRGELEPGDCSGGVFSVSYLGAYEVENFIAIVNPGEAAILAMGRTIEQPVAVHGEVVVRPMAKLTLSCDHRSIDGALAARLMTEIKKILESTEGLVLTEIE